MWKGCQEKHENIHSSTPWFHQHGFYSHNCLSEMTPQTLLVEQGRERTSFEAHFPVVENSSKHVFSLLWKTVALMREKAGDSTSRHRAVWNPTGKDAVYTRMWRWLHSGTCLWEVQGPLTWSLRNIDSSMKAHDCVLQWLRWAWPGRVYITVTCHSLLVVSNKEAGHLVQLYLQKSPPSSF